MYGTNAIFNQPLAIDRNYLLSLVPHILQNHQAGFISQEETDLIAEENINAQIFANSQGGANKYPVIVDVFGAIVKYSNYNYLGTQSLIRIVNALDKNPNISGILFNIDSGGGMVSGTDEFTATIQSLSKPTIAFTNGYCCSAALNIASGADIRIASPFADLIGSIGVMLSYQDFSKMFEKWGAEIVELYAPQSSEKNIEHREMSKGNKALYEESLKEHANLFIGNMKTNLPNIKDDGHVFKGKTYKPKQAVEVGLFDEIGTLEYALSKF